MDTPALDPRQFRLLAEAIAIGLLVGIERYKARGGDEKRFAGVRTFAAFALLGGVCGLFDSTQLTMVTFAAVALLVVVGYYREPGIGLTTEIAALLTFWLGYLIHLEEILAISIAIVLTIMLASKQILHGFIKNSISEIELYDTLKFLAVVLVVYPLLPDRSMGPFAFFNPAKTWFLVVLVSAIGYAGYLLMRLVGQRKGLLFSSLLGGFVSTTATTMSLASRAREAPQSARVLGVAAVSANAVQFPRLLLLLAVVDAAFARVLAAPFAAMTFAGFAGAWLISRWRRDAEPDVKMPLKNPFSLTPALRFAAFFVAVLFVVKAAQAGLGERGVFLASILGGTVSASAVGLTLARAVTDGSLALESAKWALLAGIAANALTKWVVTYLNGSRPLAFWLGGGLATMLAVGAAVLLF